MTTTTTMAERELIARSLSPEAWRDHRHFSTKAGNATDPKTVNEMLDEAEKVVANSLERADMLLATGMKGYGPDHPDYPLKPRDFMDGCMFVTRSGVVLWRDPVSDMSDLVAYFSSDAPVKTGKSADDETPDDAAYLRSLARRLLRKGPAQSGADQMDVDRLNEIAKTIEAGSQVPVPAPAPRTGDDWPEDWKRNGFNGGIVQAQRALRFLADNDRPDGGEQFPNSACCLAIADDLEVTRRRYEQLGSGSPPDGPAR